MSIPYFNVPPLDPNLETGPSRLIAGPARIRSVTTNVPYGEFARWLYIGGAGNVSITTWDGTVVTMTALAVGVWHNVASVQVNTTGTTASNILWGS